MKTTKKIISLITVLVLALTAIAVPQYSVLADSEYTLTATVEGTGGSITPAGVTTVAARNSLTCSIIPDEGYSIDKVYIDGELYKSANEYTFADFKENHTISASFKIKDLGDVDEDGYITSGDTRALIRHLISDEEYKVKADANYDGDIDIRDLVRLKSSPADIMLHDFTSENWKINDASETAVISENGNTYLFDTTDTEDKTGMVDGAYYNAEESSQWTDYQISADILYDEYDFNSASSLVSVVFRRVSNVKYYELRLTVNTDSTANIVGKFVKRASSGYTELASFDVDYIQNLIGAKKLKLGRTYNVRVLCKGNVFYFFLNNAFLGTCTDDDNPYMSGSIGFKSYRAKGSFSNVRVTDRTGVAYKDMYIDGSKDGECVNLRQGETVDKNANKLIIVDYDSTILTSHISDGMVAGMTNNAYFDMPFTGSYTGSALTAMGYGASGADIDTMASYISDDKIYFPKDANTTSNVFYSPYIDAENYKVKLDFKVEEKYGSGTPTYGLLLGAPNTELKDCYNFVLGVSGANGYVQSSKVRKFSLTGAGSDYTSALSVSNADRQNCVYFGALITIEADVSYDSATDTTTVNYSVTGTGKVVHNYSITVEGKLKGHAGIFSSKFGGVSFDNFQGLSTGSSVRINAFSMEKDFPINITENSVSSINTRLLSNENAAVTANNAKVYKNLLRDCDKYSDAELEGLSGEAKTVYNSINSQLSSLNVPFGDVIYSTGFSNSDNTDWYNDFEYDKGKKYIENSKLHISQIPYGISTNCYYLSNTYGEGSAVSADICMNSYYAAAGLVLNLGKTGGYQATVTLNRDTDNVNDRESATVRIYRKTSNGANTVATKTKVDICRAEWFNMQLCFSADNVISLYINYSLVCSADLSNSPEIFSEGYAGVISSSGDADFDNFSIYGNSASAESSAVTPDVTYFNEDFEGGTNDYFLEEAGSNNWSVKTEDDNSYYGVNGFAGISDISRIGDNTVLFTEDFNSYGNNASGAANRLAMVANGWEVPNNVTGNYNTGATYEVPAAKAAKLLNSNLEGSSEWGDYVVSCDITFNQDAEGKTHAYILGRITEKAGYWLRVWAEDGVLTGYEVQTVNNFVKVNVLGTAELPSEKKTPCGEQFNAKIAFVGSNILCYLNDELILSVENAQYSQGCAGLFTHTSNVSSVTFDNFEVYKTDLIAPQASRTYLHVFETNPTLNFRMKYESNVADYTDFGVVVRNSPDTAYLKVGYDIAAKKWYVNETKCEGDLPVNLISAQTSKALSENVWHDITLAVSGDTVTLTVDSGSNDEYSYVFSGVSNCGTGKIGFYTNNTILDIDDVSITLPDGDTALLGIVEYSLYDDTYMAVFEIEELSDGSLIGVGYNNVGYSTDGGLSFADVTAQKENLCDGAYPSLVKLHDGTFIRVNSKFEVYSSSDDMASWDKLCDKITDYKYGNRNARIFHVNSLCELKLSNDTYRIFLPVGVRTYSNAYTTTSSGHYTEVYYSDDGGITWEKSETDTTSILYGSKGNSSSDWTESKIVICDDGTLRMYYSRNALGCMQYTVSNDGGVTWSGLYQIPQMQCAGSSFSLIKDESSLAGDTDYYLIWVNSSPVYLGSVFSRTRLSLAKSTDGKNWIYLCDIERMADEVYSSDLTMTSPIFQIVDPSIFVNDNYVFVSYGCSGNSGRSFHNALRLKVARIDKNSVSGKAWNASNICNMLFTESLSLIETPKTQFARNEAFDYSGGTIRITRLDGTVKEINTLRMYLKEKPNMSTSGAKTIVLYDVNGFSVSYVINVS